VELLVQRVKSYELLTLCVSKSLFVLLRHFVCFVILQVHLVWLEPPEWPQISVSRSDRRYAKNILSACIVLSLVGHERVSVTVEKWQCQAVAGRISRPCRRCGWRFGTEVVISGDWVWAWTGLPERCRSYHRRGFAVVFGSSQGIAQEERSLFLKSPL